MILARPLLSFSRLYILEHIIGDKVNAITPETRTAAARVKANSVNNSPIRPPVKPMCFFSSLLEPFLTYYQTVRLLSLQNVLQEYLGRSWYNKNHS